MKVSGMLGGLLLLSVLTHGSEEVSVTCTEYWLRVRIRRIPILENLQPRHYELHLGTGCPVTRVMHRSFEFVYPVSNCGIRKYDHVWGTFIESSLTYSPVSSTVLAHYPVSCFIERNLSLTFLKKGIDSNSRTTYETLTGPVGERNSTSSQVENMGIDPGVPFGNNFALVGVCNFLIPWSNGRVMA